MLEESLLDESSNEENEVLSEEEGDESTSCMVSTTLDKTTSSIVSRSASSMDTASRGKLWPEANKDLGRQQSHQWWLTIGGYI